MNNEDRIGGLNDQFSRFGIKESTSDRSSIHQIINAVEVAQSTIIQQMAENQQLKDQILRQTQELEKFKLESSSQQLSSDITREDYTMETYKAHESQTNDTALDNPLQSNTRNRQLSESIKLNGNFQSCGIQNAADSTGVSQLSTPSSRSLSPTRHIKDGEYDSKFHSTRQGLIPILDTSSNNLWKQDIAVKVREHEEEISLLRKHLADYSVKVEKLQNEKCVLEKRIAYMRMAFDQQQQDLVDAASKALSYRQDIIEENIRLTYVLQAAQQERSTFISSLLPLLTEYSLQPSVPDAQSIVSNLKALFKHLQERLVLNEDSNAFFQYKLNESQLQLTSWQAESSNTANCPPQSPSHSFGATVTNPNKSLEIVPQPSYSHAQSSPVSSRSNALINRSNGFVARNSEPDGLESITPSVSRNTLPFDTSIQDAQSDHHVVRSTAESKDQNQSFKNLVRNEVEVPDSTGLHRSRESTIHWTPTSSPYMPSGLDDPNSSYPYLPPVLEEPSSSFSEAAEDDPLPGIDGLQISGEAFPGRELQASGYSINGTTSCNFEWVRYLEDGSVKYIEGARQPKYLVTADDVDSYLAIEVHPLDDRKRKGELVKVFANEQRKITCDPEMREQLERALSVGHVSYEVLLSVQYLDMWEPAVLAIKKEGYSIKCNGPRGVVMTEKFTPTTEIIIPMFPNAHPADFLIHCSDNEEYLLRAKDSSWLRDIIVLTMRLFRKMALEKKKGRKKGRFFKS